MLEYYQSNPWPRVSKIIYEQYGRNWGGGRSIYPEYLWLGVTAENQEQADKRIPILLQIPAAVRFVSVEPMLSAVDMKNIIAQVKFAGDGKGWPEETRPVKMNTLYGYRIESPMDDEDGKPIYYDAPTGAIPKIDWVICGGESGPGARPMHPDWARSLRDQCQAARVPFFFKQWGEWMPDSHFAETQEFRGWITGEGRGMCITEAPGFTHIHPWGDGICSFKVGKKKAGCLLDGVEHKEYPDGK